MEEKKTRKKRTVKPIVDDRQAIIKDIQRQLNSLEFGKRIRTAGDLKNGKINLNFIK